jgi:hypothetical protein
MKTGALLAAALIALSLAGCVSITAPGSAPAPGSSPVQVDQPSPGPTASGSNWSTLLPGLPDPTTARVELAALGVAPRTHTSTYKRDLFKTWDMVSGACDTRETVLKRDGRDVRTSASCAAASGVWTSPYDGKTWTSASDVDIDHLVPLGNAWVSGAWAWSNDQRERFANDLQDPQLVAVTDNVNESKGDRSPDEWKPPLASFYCPYAEAWIRVKFVWQLSVTDAEKATLTSMLSTC